MVVGVDEERGSEDGEEEEGGWVKSDGEKAELACTGFHDWVGGLLLVGAAGGSAVCTPAAAAASAKDGRRPPTAGYVLVPKLAGPLVTGGAHLTTRPAAVLFGERCDIGAKPKCEWRWP